MRCIQQPPTFSLWFFLDIHPTKFRPLLNYCGKKKKKKIHRFHWISFWCIAPMQWIVGNLSQAYSPPRVTSHIMMTIYIGATSFWKLWMWLYVFEYQQVLFFSHWHQFHLYISNSIVRKLLTFHWTGLLSWSSVEIRPV